MGWFCGHYPVNILLPEDFYFHTWQHPFIPASEWCEAYEARLSYVLNHESNFIHVGAKHKPPLLITQLLSVQVTHTIHIHPIRVSTELSLKEASNPILEP